MPATAKPYTATSESWVRRRGELSRAKPRQGEDHEERAERGGSGGQAAANAGNPPSGEMTL